MVKASQASNGKNYQPSGLANLAETVANMQSDISMLVGRLEQAGGNLIGAAEAIKNQDAALAEKMLKEAYRIDEIEYVSTTETLSSNGTELYKIFLSVAPELFNEGSTLYNASSGGMDLLGTVASGTFNSKILTGLQKALKSLETVENGVTSWNYLTTISKAAKALSGLNVVLGVKDAGEGLYNGVNTVGAAFNEFDKTGDKSEFAGDMTETVIDNGTKIVFGTAAVIVGAAAVVGAVATAPVWLTVAAGALGTVATIGMIYGIADIGFQIFTGKSIGENLGGWVTNLGDMIGALI